MVHPAMAVYCTGELPLSKWLQAHRVIVTHALPNIFLGLGFRRNALDTYRQSVCAPRFPSCLRPPAAPYARGCGPRRKMPQHDLCFPGQKLRLQNCFGAIGGKRCVLHNAMLSARTHGLRIELSRDFDFARANGESGSAASVHANGTGGWWENYMALRSAMPLAAFARAYDDQ